MALDAGKKVLGWQDILLAAEISCSKDSQTKWSLKVRAYSLSGDSELSEASWSPVVHATSHESSIVSFRIVDVLGLPRPALLLLEAARESEKETWTTGIELFCISVKHRRIDLVFSHRFESAAGSRPVGLNAWAYLLDGPSVCFWDGMRTSLATIVCGSNVYKEGEVLCWTVAADLIGFRPIICLPKASGDVDVWAIRQEAFSCMRFSASCLSEDGGWKQLADCKDFPIPPVYIPLLTCVEVLSGVGKLVAQSVGGKFLKYPNQRGSQDGSPSVILCGTTYGQLLLVVGGHVAWIWDVGFAVVTISWIVHCRRLLVAAKSDDGACSTRWLGEEESAFQWNHVTQTVAVDLLSHASQQLLVLTQSQANSEIDFILTNGVQVWGRKNNEQATRLVEEESNVSSLQSTVFALQHQCRESQQYYSHCSQRSQHKAAMIDDAVRLLQSTASAACNAIAVHEAVMVPLLEGDIRHEEERTDERTPCPLEIACVLDGEQGTLCVELKNAGKTTVYHPVIALVPLFEGVHAATIAVNHPPSFQNCLVESEKATIALLPVGQTCQVQVEIPSHYRSRQLDFGLVLHWLEATNDHGMSKEWRLFSHAFNDITLSASRSFSM